ncbi:MAG TPA: hypothetical protein VE338_05440 [Ktedonobacterales bacterium]|jgi:type II secretory pathway pseudopilin PulG|nr:hypothetical protein [Ktedonobacterales bacterium]
MRTITRTGVILSVVAALALYGLQLIAGLVVSLGIIAFGVIAGLSVAKWLERDWYGRQLDAGARAGAIACGVAGLSAMIYLLGQGPHTTAELAARSHLLGVSLAPVALALSPLGAAGTDIATTVIATLLGVAMAALTAQVFGWGKDKRSLQLISQARLAAQSQQRGEIGAQATPSGGRPTSPSVKLYGRTDPAGALPGAIRRTAVPEPRADAEATPLAFESWDDADGKLTAIQPPAAAKAKLPKPRRPSNARSADHAITDDERAALLAWESALADGSQPGAASRAPKASEFLTQPAAAPKRNRKKQNTRDWLC